MWDVADICADVTAGDWLRDRVSQSHWATVGSLVPPTFDSYCRILHPPRTGEGGWTRWSTVAQETGAAIHPTVEWAAITNGRGRSGGGGTVWAESPERGELVVEQRATLADVVAAHTTTPDDCWFAVWEGQSFVGVDRAGPRVCLPGRNHYLFHGRVADVRKDFQGHGPSLWWPADRAWVVASDVDLTATYIGCSHECADQLLRSADLEVVSPEPNNSVTWDSDTITPLPRPPHAGG